MKTTVVTEHTGLKSDETDAVQK